MAAYEGNENYIFLSYAHKDSHVVLPIVEGLIAMGFRIWYDSGIEAGTEWPEYIEDHLKRASVVLVFMSPSTVASRNCRNEINFALELDKDILVAYMEDTELGKGMRLQLNSSQFIYRNNHATEDSFFQALAEARILQHCREGGPRGAAPRPEPAPAAPQGFHTETPGFPTSMVSNICSIGTNDVNDLWPKGVYSTKINRDTHNVVFFHMRLLRRFGFHGTIRTHYRIYNSGNDLVFDHETTLAIQPDYDRISTGWILKGNDGSFVPSGEYRFECSINGSPAFSYHFTVCGNEDRKKRSFLRRLFS